MSCRWAAGRRAKGDGEGAVVLPRLVARWEDAGVLRGAQRQLRRVHDSRGRGRGDAADHGGGSRRRPGVLAGWEVHLLQLGSHRADADLADEAGRQRAGAGDSRRRLQQLVRARLAGRPADGVSHLREGRRRTSREQGSDVTFDDASRPENPDSHKTVWRTGHHQRAVVVARSAAASPLSVIS